HMPSVFSRVGDARRKRVDADRLRYLLEPHERVGLGAADPLRVGPPIDVERVRGLAPARLDRELPGAEATAAGLEAGEDARAEAGDPEVAARVEAEAARGRERRVDHPDLPALRVEPPDPPLVQLAEPDAAVGR